jgi:DNA anti-recombination protein RmuC
MTNLNKVVTSLRDEYSRLEKEMHRVGRALEALGNAGGNKLKRAKRTLSKEARERIAAAQRLRWAKVRKQAAKLVKS